MLIPLRSDAPAIYRPFGTVAIGLVTIAVGLLADPVRHPEVWLLQFGVVRPRQWLTHVFVHGSVLHLVSNMLFLFWFGQIVEGRLGWKRFVPLYFGLAIAAGAVEQTLMLAAGHRLGWSLGATEAVFGTMIIAFFWDPGARFESLFLPWPVRLVACPLAVLCGAYLAIEFLVVHFSGHRMGSSVLHLHGAAIGVLPAILLPRTGWVHLGDWEGILDPWRRVRPAKAHVVSEDPVDVREAARAAVLERIEEAVAAKDGAAAVAFHARAVEVLGRFELPPLTERKLIRCLIGEGRHAEALTRIEAYLYRGLPDSEPLRLTQAELLVRHMRRPGEAEAVLASLNHDLLTPELEKEFARIARLVGTHRAKSG